MSSHIIYLGQNNRQTLNIVAKNEDYKIGRKIKLVTMNDISQSEPIILPFYGGYNSQWFRCEFTIDRIRYNCAEQYMMAEKARFFENTRIETSIMKAVNPKVQKALGRKIKDFDPVKWGKVARDIVYKGNYAKFFQNPTLRTLLLSTGDSTLVEASPYDAIWGIGIALGDPKVNDPTKWNGTNWLGEVLMKVRYDINAGIETKENFNWNE